jgi:ribonuclease HII
MLIYAGIDEAGYGPMLGPLCVAGAVFVLAEHDPGDGAPDLWRKLCNGVCRERKDRRQRIAVDDSKRLKGANDGRVHPLKHLERGVLAFLANTTPPLPEGGGRGVGVGLTSNDNQRACATSSDSSSCSIPVREGEAPIPARDVDLFARLHVTAPPAAWYGSTTDLPLAHTADELRIASSKLNRVMREAGITCADMRCEAIDAGPFNQHIARTKSKANVNMAAALRLVDRIWQRWPREHPRVILDRHGGRLRYREELQLAWPEAAIRILAESESLSRYRLSRGSSHITLSFMREADGGHLPVALASMTAKLVRELFMLRFNRFFRQHLPELKPTAGYVHDARRYLRDIETLMTDLKIDREQLVRNA